MAVLSKVHQLSKVNAYIIVSTQEGGDDIMSQ